MNDFYITVYKPIAGYKAVLMHKEEGPYQTGLQGYSNESDAINEGLAWATAEEIPFSYKTYNYDPEEVFNEEG